MSVPIRRIATAALGAALVLTLAGLALADPIDEAKATGQVGEQADGYLGIPPGAPVSAGALATATNAKRKQRYAAIAAKNGIAVGVVAKLAGQKLIAKTPPGQYYRNAAGSWQRKPL